MDDSMNKLEHFTATILSDASQRSQKLLESLEKTKAARLAAAEREIRARSARQAEAEIAKVHSATGRILSQRMMENKRNLFIKREEVARGIAADLRGRLAEWVQGGQYATWLKQQLVTALAQLPQGAQPINVACRSQDLKPLEAALFGSHHPFFVEESPDILLGGLRVECPECHIIIDCTLDTSFAGMQGHIAEYLGLRLE